MRITVTVPDEIGVEVKERTDNVSAFVTEALLERLDRLKRLEARERIRGLAGSTRIKPSVYKALQKERGESDRS